MVPTKRWVAVAEVARPHGIRGELRLKPYNLDSDMLLRKSEVLLRMPDGSERAVSVAAARAVNKAVLVELRGVSDRNGAEALRGAVVCADRDGFPDLEEGEFYACDLEGARVVLPDGSEVGRVRTLRSYPTCDVLEVSRAEGIILEVPLVDSYVQEIDVAGGLVRLITVEGL
ncbi:MAG: ribosome maturation factor RimM [Polyangiaceae bacterium]